MILKPFNAIIVIMILSSFIITKESIDKKESYESLVSSCNPKTVRVHRAFYPQVREYIAVLESEGVDITFGKDLCTIDFSSTLPRNILGIAWGMNVDNVTHVEINEFTWWNLSYNQKKFLIWHELSHDVFNLEHYSTLMMSTPMPGYIDELYLHMAMEQLIIKLKNRQNGFR